MTKQINISDSAYYIIITESVKRKVDPNSEYSSKEKS